MDTAFFDDILEDEREDEYIGKEELLSKTQNSKTIYEKKKKKSRGFVFTISSKIVKYFLTLEYFLFSRVQGRVMNFLKRSFHFFRYNFGEVIKRRMAYFLGMFSVVLVVIACTSTISVTEQLPMIFFRIAENTEGQYDMVIRSDRDVGWSINFTHLVLSLKMGTTEEQYEEYSNVSPRMTFAGNTHLVDYKTCIRKDNGDPLPIWYDGNNREDIDWVYLYPDDSLLLNETSITSECSLSKNEDSTDKECDLSHFCEDSVNIPVVLIDTTREKDMGYGRDWEFSPLDKGECIITDKTADRFGIEVGEDVIIGGDIFGYHVWNFLGLLEDSGYIEESVLVDYDGDSGTSEWDYIYDLYYDEEDGSEDLDTDEFKFPCRIKGIIVGHQGKTDYTLDINEAVVFMEYESFYEHMGTYLDMRKFEEYSERIKNANPYDYAHYVYVNAKDRGHMYNSANYDTIRDRVTEFAGTFLYIVGFDQVRVRYPLLWFLEGITFIGLFLNLIINIIVTILVGISMILIYSLLMIHVEERTFEIGVLRMMGLRLFGLLEMIIMQSMMYSVPGIILGLVIGSLLYFLISVFLLSFYLNISVSPIINLLSVLLSVSVGTLIPLAGSVIPIKKAMKKSLNESLDTRRSKVKAIKIRIERSTDKSIPWSLVIISCGSFIFGFFIYYFFPLAMITQKFQLLLFVFFCVLLMMLIGCVLLSINLEGILQNVVTRIIFFWEFSSVQKLVMKNLIAHKTRNRKTTIMYGISLSFLIFLSVATTLEIRLYEYSESRIVGARFRLQSSIYADQHPTLYSTQHPASSLLWDELDDMVATEKYVEDYAYMSFPISKMTNDSTYMIQTIGGYYEASTDFSAISPNFYEVLDRKYEIVTSSDPSLSSSSWELSEHLYTVDGAYGYMGGLGEQKYLIKSNNDLEQNVVYRIERPTELYTKYTYFLKRFNSIMESASGSTFSKYDTETSIHVELFTHKVGADGFISFPEMFQILNEVEMPDGEGKVYQGVNDIPIRFIYVKVPSSAPEKEALRIKKRIIDFLNENLEIDLSMEDRKERLDRLNVVDNVLSIFFYLSTSLAMLMCFFGLIANMITNVSEQSKEIGILRAVGCRKFTITRVYVYEAIVIVYTAGIIGTCSGTFIAYTLVLQQQLFTQLPLGFAFPTEIVIIVLLGGIVLGFFASIFPICCLIRKSPVQIMRRL